MPANVETMFYAGETPWHGLGVPVLEAQSSADALRLSGLDWEVQSKRIQVAGGSGIDGYKANVRSTDGKVLGIVTDRYKIVQNREAFAFTDMLLGEGVKYETAGSLSNGQRIWMLARMDTTKICGDDVTPYLVFTNSHDGTGAIKAAMTPIRVVCQNTLTAALRGAKRTWSTKHCGDINGKMEDAKNTLLFANQYMAKLEEQADIMTQIVVPNPMFIEYLYKMFPISNDASERQKRNVEYQRNALREIYDNKDDIKKFNGTAWGLMMAACDYAPHFRPLRETSTYRENNFMRIVDGDSLIENTSKFISNIA